jgi:hypothetical protein
LEVSAAVDGSPKFHDQLFTVPNVDVVLSVKIMDELIHCPSTVKFGLNPG